MKDLKYNYFDYKCSKCNILSIKLLNFSGNNRYLLQFVFYCTFQVDWLDLFHQIAPKSIHSLITNGTEIIVSEVEYMHNIATLISNHSKHSVANYIFWRIVHSWVKILDKRYEDIKHVIFLLRLINQDHLILNCTHFEIAHHFYVK